MAQINCVHEYHNKCQLTSFLLIIEINSERIGDAYPRHITWAIPVGKHQYLSFIIIYGHDILGTTT